MKPIENSSNLAAAGYSEMTKVLTVQFKNGTKYQYNDVPPDVYANFEKTFDGQLSAGSFFNAHIKKYPCVKLDT